MKAKDNIFTRIVTLPSHYDSAFYTHYDITFFFRFSALENLKWNFEPYAICLVTRSKGIKCSPYSKEK